MKKSFVLLGLVTVVLGDPTIAQQQSQWQPQAAMLLKAFVSQYADAPGRTPTGLLATGYDIRAAVADGPSLQKVRDVFNSNSSVRLEEAAIAN